MPGVHPTPYSIRHHGFTPPIRASFFQENEMKLRWLAEALSAFFFFLVVRGGALWYES